MRLKIALVVVVAFLGYLNCCVAHERADYGEACDGVSVKCNRRAHLNCSPMGKCNCTIPDSMVYEEIDGSSGVCVVKAGEQCKFQRGLDENSDPVYAIYPCIQGSACGQDGYCSCVKGFFESADGTCYPGRIHGQSCNDDTLKCLSGAALNCINGTCTCDQNSSIYDPRQGACAGLVEETCIEGRCISGVCEHDKCYCPMSQFMVNSTTCEAKRGPRETCESHDWCGQDEYTQTDLTCEGKIGVKKCACPTETSVYATVTRNLLHSHGDYSEKSLCAPKPNQPCFRGYCAPSAMCNVIYKFNQEDSDGYYCTHREYTWSFYYGYRYTGEAVCQCISPTQVSPTTGECISPYGHICNEQLSCMDSLTCVNGRCGCDQNQHYDDTSRRCLLKASQPCGSDFGCVKNSQCTQAQICTCDSGFVPSEEGLCAAEVGGSCKKHGDCDQVNNKLICNPSRMCACPPGQDLSPTTGKCSLEYRDVCDNTVPCGDTFVCKQSHCQCPSTLQTYDPTKDRCVYKVDGPCSSTTECVDRAFCQFSQNNETASLFGNCNCDPEAVETREGLCTLTEGAGCETDADCDPEAGLQCMDQSCQCPTHASYSRELRSCQGLIGAPCTSDPLLGGEDQSKTVVGSCIENAICTKPRTTSLTSKCVCPV